VGANIICVGCSITQIYCLTLTMLYFCHHVFFGGLTLLTAAIGQFSALVFIKAIFRFKWFSVMQ